MDEDGAAKVVKKSVALEDLDIEIVENFAEQKGLGSRGFSAALRMILRDWLRTQNASVQRADDVIREQA